MPNPSRRTTSAGLSSLNGQGQSSEPSKKRKRRPNLYDAVAGRVSSTEGFIPDQPRFSKYRDTASSSSVPARPDEVLFRMKGAPTRYEEDDFYRADRHLTEQQALPESDLLKAIHAYASDFYSRATTTRGVIDFQSFDETALLGLGLLIEEMADHVLGDTGDLAFVETGEEEFGVTVDYSSEGGSLRDEGDIGEGSEVPASEITTPEVPSSSIEKTVGRDISTAPASEEPAPEVSSDSGQRSRRRRNRKRRKFRHDEGDT